MQRLIQQLFKPLKRQIRQLFTRGLVRLVDPGKMLQLLQVELRSGEVLDNVEHFEPYGFTSHPHRDEAEVLAASLSGRRSHTVAVMVSNRLYRIKGLAEGEVAINDDLGNLMHFKRDRILISAVSLVEVIAPACHIQAITTHDGNVTINGNLVVNGNTTVSGTGAFTGALSSASSVSDPTGTMQSMRITFNGHDHKENDNNGTTNTDAPNQTM